MGRVLLVARLAVRDLRRRPGEAALLLLAIVGTTATLTLGLVLRGLTSDPYQSTREATAGPDVVAVGWPPSADPHAPGGRDPGTLARLEALTDAAGVVGHSGPFPVTAAVIEVRGRRVDAQAMGRDTVPAAVDQPELTRGGWVENGGVVFEAAFAEALGVDVGDAITVNGGSFRVVGVAVTAALAPYPQQTCLTSFCPSDPGGLVWVTRADAQRLATDDEPVMSVLNLKLDDPAAARRFVDTHLDRRFEPGGMSWQDILDHADRRLRHQRRALLIGSWLLAVLAVASVAVLVGGRMADQTRRVGLLKAVGGTPSLAAAVLLVEYAVVALLAAMAGVATGSLTAPLVTDPGAGLVGGMGVPAITASTIGLVTATALGVTVAATLVPAIRASRTSTVLALVDSARPPRRTPWLITLSARLPVPLLLGLRIAARRPRRIVLNTLSIFVTVSGIVAVLGAHINAGQLDLDRPGIERLNQVLLVITITLVALAAVNAIFITWATALDARHSTALARALGATPHEISAGLSTAQVPSALVGAILGIPGGLGLLAAVGAPNPPLWQLLVVVPGTVLTMAALTTIPARQGARRPVAETLQSELI